MSHALYRKGTQRNLANDFVIMASVAKGINDSGAMSKIRQFAGIVSRYQPANMGEITVGSMHQTEPQKILSRLRDTSLVHAVFTEPATVAAVLRELKEADLGLSVTVSGLLEAVDECCRQAGLHPYGVEESLGILGRTERLPAEPILEVATMCGHGLVSFRLIEALAQRIRDGQTTAEAAANELARQCVCGIFNPVRARQLLQCMVAEQSQA